MSINIPLTFTLSLLIGHFFPRGGCRPSFSFLWAIRWDKDYLFLDIWQATTFIDDEWSDVASRRLLVIYWSFCLSNIIDGFSFSFEPVSRFDTRPPFAFSRPRFLALGSGQLSVVSAVLSMVAETQTVSSKDLSTFPFRFWHRSLHLIVPEWI